eukprot:TRINITY_DN25176_c0_g1_i1.p1 TRINITY_DN25176_c0_g1~~TRINITY_DN25176_c0_g1_i1.p1  ORF type:complete len:594 (-),score=125.81 TRINITY_DN25176_c0_g1_i1:63-1844(-)
MLDFACPQVVVRYDIDSVATKVSTPELPQWNRCEGLSATGTTPIFNVSRYAARSQSQSPVGKQSGSWSFSPAPTTKTVSLYPVPKPATPAPVATSTMATPPTPASNRNSTSTSAAAVTPRSGAAPAPEATAPQPVASPTTALAASQAHQGQADASSPSALQEIESQVIRDPQFKEELQRSRKAALGLDEADVKAFLDKAEFSSLGCFCGVSTCLMSLGLRRCAQPFDWVRSPIDGVTHLLETDFEDFLTFTSCAMESSHQVFRSTRWGGSFWHHDPEAPGTREEFTRRIERFLGLRDSLAESPRVFLRALNSTRELHQVQALRKALERCFPKADQIYLLVIIDLQDSEELLRLDQFGDQTLFAVVPKDVWVDYSSQPAAGTTQSSDEVRNMMDRAGTLYAKALSQALRYWVRRSSAKDGFELQRLGDAAELSSRLVHFDGGCCCRDSFWPRQFRGQRIHLCKSASERRDDDTEVREASAGPGLIAPLPDASADVCLPNGIKGGDFLETEAFGRHIKIQVPEGACAGLNLRLHFAQGVLTSTLLATSTAATLTTAAATATATTAVAAAMATTAAGAESATALGRAGVSEAPETV